MTALLTDNLPLLAGAPNGIQKLRELILELAVRGKLVPQDPSDEPASELLKRIAEEKARLVAEGKIRKPKPLAEIGEEEKPFWAPHGWELARLGSVGDWAVGSGFPTQEQGLSDLPILFCKVSDMNLSGNERFIVSAINSIDSATAERLRVNVHSAGTVIFPKIGGAIATNKRRILVKPTAIDNNCLGLSPNGALSSDYLYLLLSAIDLTEYQAGTSVPALSQGVLADIIVGVPPLAEQHRIVAKVDELMALCDRLEARQADAESAHARLVQALLDSLTQASAADDFAASWQRLAEHFHSLFTSESSIDALKQALLQLAVMGKLVPQDPSDEPAIELLERANQEKAQLYSVGKIRKPKLIESVSTDEEAFDAPLGWVWVRLSQVTTQLGDGLHGTPVYSVGGEYFFVNGNNLRGGRIVIKPETKRVDESEYERHKKPLGERTVLVSINGTIGNVAFYDSEKIVLGKSACYFNLSDGVSKDFIRFLIESPVFMTYALSSATGTTIKNLGLKAINDYPLALPPTNEQHRIVAKVDQLMALCEQLKTRLTTARQLHERLAGALVEQAVA